MKIRYQALVTYEIDDVDSFREAASVFKTCVQADSAIDGVSLIAITDVKASAIQEEEEEPMPDPESIDAELAKWDAQYKPLANHLNADASWGGCMFEIHGVEQDYVYAFDYHYVWTYMDVDGGTALVAGRHFVNRIGYLITAEPWTDDETLVWVSLNEDDPDN